MKKFIPYLCWFVALPIIVADIAIFSGMIVGADWVCTLAQAINSL